MSNKNLIIKHVKTTRNGKPVTRVDVMTKKEMDAIYKRQDTIESIVISVIIGLAIAGIFALGIAITPSGWA